MATFFTEDNNFNPVEMLYAPPGTSEPADTDNETAGSSTHASVFNRRLKSLVDRTKYLYNLLNTGRIQQLLAIVNPANKILGFDANGNLIASNVEVYEVGFIRWCAVIADSNPFKDSQGFFWYVPDGTPLSPANPVYERLYKAVWGYMTTAQISGGKGASADADWASGKNMLFPDCRERGIAMRSTGRLINQFFGSNQVSLAPENYRHNHNFSVRGVRDTNLNFDAAGGFGLLTFGTPRTGATGATPTNSNFGTPNPTNIAGNRTAVNDGAGAIWENTATAAAPVNLPSPPGISFDLRIYTGVRAL